MHRGFFLLSATKIQLSGFKKLCSAGSIDFYREHYSVDNCLSSEEL